MSRAGVWALLLAAVLSSGSLAPALACHACLVGEPCPPHGGCGGESLDVRRAVVIVFEAGTAADVTRWTLRGHPTRIQPLSPIPGVFLRGRIGCRGALCVGRYGRFSGHFLSLAEVLRVDARFRNESSCEFAGSLDGEEPTNNYRCFDPHGRLASEGPFDVTVSPILPRPGTEAHALARQ